MKKNIKEFAKQVYYSFRTLYWTQHEKEMLSFYSQFISPGDLVFDVGANIGNRSRIFLELGSEVVAIEPQEACVKILESIYGKKGNLTIIQKALGALEGEAELMISDTSVLSSLSQNWIDAVKSSGRFGEISWEDKEKIMVTTLDQLIDKYGEPTFIKIDVEGYEYEVIKGLSSPIKFISFEFTPEYIEAILMCIDHLDMMGDIFLNYSLGESMKLVLNNYIPPKKMKEILESYKGNNKIFGDVYCQFKNV